MIYQCCDREAQSGGPRESDDQRHRLSRGAGSRGHPAEQSAPADVARSLPEQSAANLTPSNILITGGESVTGIAAQWVIVASAPPPPQAVAAGSGYFQLTCRRGQHLVIRTSVAGDFSPYCLRLVNNAPQARQDSFDVTEALAGFDPMLTEVRFSFKVECGPDFDCAPLPPDCPPSPAGAATDQLPGEGLRIVPPGHARPPQPTHADLGRRDRSRLRRCARGTRLPMLATSSAISRTRSRPTLTFRLRAAAFRCAVTPDLVDYFVHDGCNARAWIRLQVAMQVFLDHTTRFYTYRTGYAVHAGRRRRQRRSCADCRRHRVRADAGCGAVSRAEPDVLLHLGRYELLPAARERRKRRCLAASPTCSRAMC